MYKCILTRASWNALVKVSPEAVAELEFRQSNARLLNREGKVLRESIVATFCMYTDASAVGYVLSQVLPNAKQCCCFVLSCVQTVDIHTYAVTW